MIVDRRKTLTCAAALTLIACGGASRPASPAPASAATPPAPPAAPDRRKVRGRLAPEIIQKVVRANFGGMRQCYEEGLGRDAALSGKISTQFVIERDGTVSSAADIHDATPIELPGLPPEVLKDRDPALQAPAPRFPDAKVTACVVARFKALKFPEPQGGIVTVVYPIVFQPGD